MEEVKVISDLAQLGAGLGIGLAALGVGLGIETSAEVYVGAKRVFLFEEDIAADVVIPNVGLTCGMIILALEAVQTVVVILGEQGSTIADGFEIARLVVGVVQRRRICARAVNVACHTRNDLGGNGLAILGGS